MAHQWQLQGSNAPGEQNYCSLMCQCNNGKNVHGLGIAKNHLIQSDSLSFDFDSFWHLYLT